MGTKPIATVLSYVLYKILDAMQQTRYDPSVAAKDHFPLRSQP